MTQQGQQQEQQDEERYYKAVYRFEGHNDIELTVNPGDVLVSSTQPQENWLLVERMADNARGYVPVSYLMEVSEKEIENERGDILSRKNEISDRPSSVPLVESSPRSISNSVGQRKNALRPKSMTRSFSSPSGSKTAPTSSEAILSSVASGKTSSPSNTGGFSHFRQSGGGHGSVGTNSSSNSGGMGIVGSAFSRTNTVHTRHELLSYDRAEQLFEQIMKQRASLFKKIEENLNNNAQEIAVFQKKNEALIEQIKRLDNAIELEKKQVLESA